MSGYLENWPASCLDDPPISLASMFSHHRKCWSRSSSRHHLDKSTTSKRLTSHLKTPQNFIWQHNCSMTILTIVSLAQILHYCLWLMQNACWDTHLLSSYRSGPKASSINKADQEHFRAFGLYLAGRRC